jgi:SAM-dependent methyltransferase
VSEIDAARRSYDEIADSYAAALAGELEHKPLDRALLAAFAEIVGTGPVADLGCGPGHIAAYLSRLGVRPVGLDLSPRMGAVGRRSTGLPFAAADLRALPMRSAGLAGIVCCYAVIHLDLAGRRAAYREFARILAPGGSALIAFHVEDAETASGSSRRTSTMLDHAVELTFHFLDPSVEVAELAAAGLPLTARLDREPHPGEHASRRSYLLVQRPG